MRFPRLPVVVPQDTDRIPRRVHVMWVGGEPPRVFWRSVERWRDALPDWEVHAWTDDEVRAVPVLGALLDEALAEGIEARGIADILRVYLVALHGGWYFDADLVLLQPLREDMPAVVYDIVPTQVKPSVLLNGCFGATKGHPLTAAVLHLGEQQMARGVTNVHHTFGPRTYRRAVTMVQEAGWPLAVEHRVTMACTAAERAAQTIGDGRYDLNALRRTRPGVTLAHIWFECSLAQEGSRA